MKRYLAVSFLIVFANICTINMASAECYEKADEEKKLQDCTMNDDLECSENTIDRCVKRSETEYATCIKYKDRPTLIIGTKCNCTSGYFPLETKCVPCKHATGVAEAKGRSNAMSIEECYVSTVGTSLSDEKGIYIITDGRCTFTCSNPNDEACN